MMLRKAVVAVVVMVVVALGMAASVAGQENCNGVVNEHPVFEDEPTFVTSMPHGTKYTAGPASMSPKLSIIHVYGTSYEMGQAYGALMKDEISEMLPQTYTYIYAQIAAYVKSLPPALQKIIEQDGTAAALQFTYDATKPFIPQHYIDRVQGMANSTGLSFDDIMRISLFPELIKASCSMFGAWDSATANTDSGLVQLRALDWTTDGPFQQFPLVINYHPTPGTGNGHAYSVLTWAGLVGAISGYSSANVAISEKVWLKYHLKDTVFGIPFHFLLEDIIHFDIDADQAMSRIATANRTCSIFIGIGDKYNNYFKAVEYSHETVNFYNPRNFPVYPNHDRFDDLVFIDKHTQPSADPCLNSLMHKYFGSLDPMTTLRYITSQFQTGDMHIAIYDFKNDMMYVSNASPQDSNGTVVKAYDNPFIRLNMTDMWSKAAPAL